MAETPLHLVEPEPAALPFVASVEHLRDALEELKLLIPHHYRELSEHGTRGYALEPNYREYLLRDDCGQVLFVALREGRTLVGYFVGFVTRCLHYGAVTLTEDIMYVMPGKRGLDGGNALLSEVEREAARRGCDPCKIGFKEAHARHMAWLLESRGYAPFERTWVKWLQPLPEVTIDEG